MKNTSDINNTIRDIHQISHLNNPTKERVKDTNLSDNDTSLHSNSVRGKVFTKLSYNKNINNVITGFCLIYWIGISIKFYRTLIVKTTSNTFSINSRKKFIPFMFIIILYPVIYFSIQLFHNNTDYGNVRLTNISPSYPVCTKSYDELTSKEKKNGAIGKIDYKCQHKTGDFNRQQGNNITKKTYYIIHAIFTLILFLFTQSAGKFKDSLITSNSIFITLLIQQALFIALVILSISTFTDHFYLTTFITLFFINLLQILGAITIMLVSFILFRLIYLFV